MAGVAHSGRCATQAMQGYTRPCRPYATPAVTNVTWHDVMVNGCWAGLVAPRWGFGLHACLLPAHHAPVSGLPRRTRLSGWPAGLDCACWARTARSRCICGCQTLSSSRPAADSTAQRGSQGGEAAVAGRRAAAGGQARRGKPAAAGVPPVRLRRSPAPPGCVPVYGADVAGSPPTARCTWWGRTAATCCDVCVFLYKPSRKEGRESL
jgi:hypothetical protein